MDKRRYFNKAFIEKLFFEFIECSSISGTAEEVEMGNLIYERFSSLPYFQHNTEYLNRHFIPNDRLKRFAVTAMVRGKGKRTVILLNHFDIVEYDEFGKNKDYALNPKELHKHLNPKEMDSETEKDFLSGEWYFGRGTGDMKFGGAMEAALTMDVSEQKDLIGNIIFLGVPDEENNSAGMLAAISALNDIKKKFDLDYVAIIDSEPHMKQNGKHAMDLGAVGKIMPLVVCVGKEGHSGMLFDALNAVPMLSEVVGKLEFSTDFVDCINGTYTLPPTTLKINDNKTLYNVTMPYIAYTYFTISTLTLTAKDITDKLKAICNSAMDQLQKKITTFCKEYEKLSGEKHEISWQPKIYTYKELYDKNYKKQGQKFVKHMKMFVEKQATLNIDEREATISIVKELIRTDTDNLPKIVIAYIPPFYSHTINAGNTEKEKYLLECAEKIKRYSAEQYGEEWEIVNICKQISDMSCCNVGDLTETTQYLTANMPLLGNGYDLPIEDLQEFDVPPINIGYYAKDLHEPFERMEKAFAFDVAPELLEYAVKLLLNPKED